MLLVVFGYCVMSDDLSTGLLDWVKKNDVPENVIVIKDSDEFRVLVKDMYYSWLQSDGVVNQAIFYNSHSSPYHEYDMVDIFLEPGLSDEECYKFVDEYYNHLNENSVEIYNGISLGFFKLHKELCLEVSIHRFNCNTMHKHDYNQVCFDEIAGSTIRLDYKDCSKFPEEFVMHK